MENGVSTTPKPHLLLIGSLSLISISWLTTQSIIKKLSYPNWVWPLIIVIIIWTLGKLSRTQTPVLNSQGNVREDYYLPHDIHLSKFGAQVAVLTINRLLKQIVRSTQPKSQFRFLKFPFPLSKLKNIWLGFFLRDTRFPLLLNLYHLPFPEQIPNRSWRSGLCWV